MHKTTAIFLTAAALFLSSPIMHPAAAAAAANRPSARVAQATEVSAQARRRPRVRIYRSVDERGVYPSYFPGSNAVRDCSATYVQEYRPSGTVIVPRMTCFWRRP